MTNVFDITTYGAVGDGVTDCTKAIQNAIDDATGVRGVVQVPPGNYATGRLKLGKGVILEGHSGWSFRSDGASILTLNTADTDCLLDITGAFGCALRGICLAGGQLGQGIHGVKLYWPVYNGGSEEDTPTIDDCRIGGFSGDGVHLEHIWCFSVRHSMLHRNAGAGLYIDGWDGFLTDNWFSGNRGGGMTGGPCCASVTATGNRVEWNSPAGFDLPNCNCCNFTGNYFDRSGGPALRLGGEKESCAMALSITGNLIYRSGKPRETPFEDEYQSCHILLRHGENVTVTGNSFRLGQDDGGVGTWSPSYVAVIEDSENCVFSANSWGKGCLKEGFILRGENRRVEIQGNMGAPEAK